MLVVSLKTSRKKILTAVAVIICVAAALAAIAAAGKPHGNDKPKESSSITIGSKITGSEDIRRFLSELGWETAEVPAETMDVLIPEQFDDVMQRYNALQQENGGDLTSYCGKTVKRFTFVITNHPQGSSEEVRANVLVYNDKIIGGDVCSLASDGFMHGLSERFLSE